MAQQTTLMKMLGKYLRNINTYDMAYNEINCLKNKQQWVHYHQLIQSLQTLQLYNLILELKMGQNKKTLSFQNIPHNACTVLLLCVCDTIGIPVFPCPQALASVAWLGGVVQHMYPCFFLCSIAFMLSAVLMVLRTTVDVY